MQVLVTKNTAVEKSDKVFEGVAELSASSESGSAIKLDEVKNLVAFQSVSVEAKVVGVEVPSFVSGGKKLQNVILGDCSGTVKLVLWEEEVGRLDEDVCYKMTGLNVKVWKGKNYLSTLKGKFKFEEISDLGEVEVAESEEESDVLEMNRVLTASNVRVAAVTQLTTYNGCIQCCAKIVCSDDPEIGTCTRCKTMQLISEGKEELSAHVLIRLNTGVIPLRAFGKVVQDMAGNPEGKITIPVLLKAGTFTMSHRDGVIQAITRNV